MKVVVTRPAPESARWMTGLSDAGHEAISLPLIEIQPQSDTTALQAEWRHIAEYDAVMFVSGNAVRHFYACKPPEVEVFQEHCGIKARALVTGPGSLQALLALGAQAARIDAPAADAEQYDSEALWQTMRHRVHEGWRVLVVRGGAGEDVSGVEDSTGQGRDWFAQQVQAAGGVVRSAVAYRRLVPAWTARQHSDAKAAARDGAVWLITSSEAINNLCVLCAAANWGQSPALVTHPRIGEAARRIGFGRVVESRPSLESILASLKSLQ